MGDLVQLAEFRREPLIDKRECATRAGMSVPWVNKQIEAEKKRPGSGIPFVKMGDSPKSAVRFYWSKVQARLDRRASVGN